MRRVLAFCLLLAAASVPALAANFSGKWALQSASGRGAGRGATVLTLTHAGDEVTGTIGIRIDKGTTSPVNEEIWSGKVEGDTLSFYVWTGTDQPVKTSYRGTISPSGDEIVFTVTRAGAGSGGPGSVQAAGGRGANAGAPLQMTARRVK